MKTRKPHTALALVLVAIGVGLSPVASAERDAAIPFAAELDSCVSEVYAHLDLTDAERVRHMVVREKRTGIGYALNIETTVYSDSAPRRYSAYCVTSGDHAPTKFRIDERSDS